MFSLILYNFYTILSKCPTCTFKLLLLLSRKHSRYHWNMPCLLPAPTVFLYRMYMLLEDIIIMTILEIRVEITDRLTMTRLSSRVQNCILKETYAYLLLQLSTLLLRVQNAE